MNQIVIRVLWPQPQLPMAQWQCEYSVLSPENEQQPVRVMDLSAAFQEAAVRQQAEHLESIVLLPGELAILNCVQLPARNQRQALQALPFVVEEQLAEDIEKVHLAVGAKRADGYWPVLVVDLAIMASITDSCEQTGLLLKAIYIDAQMLPVAEGRLSILMNADRVLFHAAQAVAVFDRASAASMIHFLVGESVISHVDIRYQADDEEQSLLAQQLSTEFSALGDTQVTMNVTDGSLATALLSLVNAATINLLQGRFVVRQPSGKLPVWQMAAAVAAFAWLGQLGLQVGSGWYFNHHAAQLEQTAEDQYRKLFPDAKHVTGVRKRLESRLLEGADANGDSSFSKLFSSSVQVFNALPNHEGMSIEQLRYESEQGQLELELKAKSIDQLDQYKQALGKIGLSGKISSANDSDGVVSGRMQISRGT